MFLWFSSFCLRRFIFVFIFLGICRGFGFVIYEDKSGNYVVTDYKYLALSTPGGTTPADMDAGMSGLEFVLTKCHGKDTSQCDFSTAQVPEL